MRFFKKRSVILQLLEFLPAMTNGLDTFVMERCAAREKPTIAADSASIVATPEMKLCAFASLREIKRGRRRERFP